MKEKGHDIIVTSRDKDITLQLLDKFGIEHECLSKQRKGKLNLLIEFTIRYFKLKKRCKQFKPDILLGVHGPVISLVGKHLNFLSYILYDNETFKFNYLIYKWCTNYLTPECFEKDYGEKQIRYPGFHQSFFLHPSRFKPNYDLVEYKGLQVKEYIVVRFVSFESSHDGGCTGIKDKLGFIKKLEQFGKFIITSEKPLPEAFEKYRFPADITEIHHILAGAKLVVSESSTMCAESAFLSTPSVYISNSKRGFTNELDKKYGLVYNFDSEEGVIEKIPEILNQDYATKRIELLKNTIDMTDWLIEFIEK